MQGLERGPLHIRSSCGAWSSGRNHCLGSYWCAVIIFLESSGFLQLSPYSRKL
ncbi:rCG43665 [Rattus norvegicus]|uniref:RCG43665 n=1 Tax=Rattus norvegicus TaxID=10116 RepID=A6JJ17_RAT|nr:rCG43665 [Rattus norvegicus]